MAWYKRDEERDDEPSEEKRSVPAGVFTKCPGCRAPLLTADLEKNDNVCPKCEHHFPLTTASRLELVLDPGTFVEEDATIESVDPLGFRDSKRYVERLRSARRSAGPADALKAGSGAIDGQPVQVGAFVFEFMGGSMGSVVGEKITRVYERALERHTPAIIFSASGGARMQEGVLSLVQMPRTIIAAVMVKEAGLPYIVVLTDPTTGGVSASFAMVGDITLAEPGAVIGFAGARVIEETIHEKLPDGFQRAEYLLEHGMVDQVVPRAELHATLGRILGLLRNPQPPAVVQPQIEALPDLSAAE